MTDEQTAQMEAEVTCWLDRGRSVEPLDRQRAADSIRALYAAVGRPTPTVLFSPPRNSACGRPEYCVQGPGGGPSVRRLRIPGERRQCAHNCANSSATQRYVD